VNGRLSGALRIGAWASLLLAGCSQTPAEPRGDVLLITIDTLRADHLGLYGYERATSPEIDRWFGGHAVYQRAYSAEAATSPSVVSILSGMLPQDHGIRLFFQLLSDDVELIPDLLPRDYQTAAIVSNMVLTDEAIGLARRFDHYDDRIDQRESARKMFERNAERTTNAALLWLAQERDPDRPLFLWVHYIDPHGPYRAPEGAPVRFEHEGKHEFDLDTIPAFMRVEGVDDGLAYVDRYDEEIAYVDAHVGRLLSGYARHRDPDAALILLTADHGETMMEHERWFNHSYHVYQPIVRVPLALRGPGVERGRVERLASGLDVAVTILAFAGVDVPAALEGRDLRRGTALSPDRTVFTEASRQGFQWRAAIRGDRKWMMNVRGPEASVVERVEYDLAADPGEANGRPWGEATDSTRRLEELVHADPDPAGMPAEYSEGVRLQAPKVAPDVSDEQLEALRALGYAE